MNSESCFLVGHADAPSHIFPVLMDSIEKHIIEYGIREFFCGNHGCFDRLAFRALAMLKQQYPHIQRILITPYHPDSKHIRGKEMADELFYPFEKPVMPRYAMIKANHKMIDLCTHMIVYVCHTGKSKDYLEYTERKSKTRRLYIDNIADRI